MLKPKPQFQLTDGSKIEFFEVIYLVGEPQTTQYLEEELRKFYQVKDNEYQNQTKYISHWIKEIVSYQNYNPSHQKQSNSRWSLDCGLLQCQELEGRLLVRYFHNTKKKYVVLTFGQLNGSAEIHNPIVQNVIQQNKMRKNNRQNDKRMLKNNYLQRLIYPRLSYQIKKKFQNYAVGCLTQNQFYSYFDTQVLGMNILKTGLNTHAYENYIWVKKPEGGGTHHSIEIITMLFNGKTLKTEFSLEKVKKLTISADGDKAGRIYFSLINPPKYYMNSLATEYSFEPFSISQWHRVQNFPILQSPIVKMFDNQLFALHLRSNVTIEVSFTNADQEMHQSFKQLLKTLKDFRAVSSLQEEKKKVSKNDSLQNLGFIFNITQFHELLKHVSKEDIPKVFQLQFCLCTLMQKNAINYQEAISLLIHLKQHTQKLQDYRDTLILLSPILVNQRSQPFIKYIVQEVRRRKDRKDRKDRKEIEMKQKQANKQAKSQLKKKELPMMFDMNTHVKIPNVKVTPSGIKFAEFTNEVRSRVLKEFSQYEHQFLKIEIVDDDGNKIPPSDYLSKQFIRQQLNQVTVLGRTYVPLAWSQSQLKNGSMWYICQNKKEESWISRQQILDFLGDFSMIMNPALKAARMGQNMASAWSFYAKYIKCTQIQDNKPSPFETLMYTDGIGSISQNIIYKIAERKGIKDLCAVQVRYKGCKGMLAVNPLLENNHIQIRQSMKKYECENQRANKYLDILESNKYKVGYLNRQIIVLLNSRGIEDSAFLYLQKVCLNQILSLSSDKKSISEHLKKATTSHFFKKDDNYDYVFLAMEHFLKIEAQKQPYIRGVIHAIQQRLLQKLKSKAHIKVDKSARLLGIIDQFKILRDHEVYCTIKKTQESNNQNIQGKAILTKNPCMVLSDIQVVTCVSDKELDIRFAQRQLPNYFRNLFINVVVFPQAGNKPLTSQISGSDLDGDQFFISWEESLIPRSQCPPHIQDQKNPKMEQLPKTPGYPEMLDFLIEYINNDKLGKLSISYLVHADMNKTASCQECIKLANIHGVAVDYPKKGYKFPDPKGYLVKHYPHWMEKTYPTVSYKSESILGLIYDQCNFNTILEKLGEKQLVNNISNFLIRVNLKKYDFKQYQINKGRKLILNYQKQLSGILAFYNLQNQFQIYIGKHVKQENKQSVAVVKELIKKYKSIFFQQFSRKQEEMCFEFTVHKLHQKNLDDLPNLPFGIQRKVILWYILTHTHFISNQDRQWKFKNRNVQQVIEIFGNQCCGMTWFCFPRLVLWMLKKIQLSY